MASILRTRWRHRSVGGGTFHCPRCDHERDYTATAVRRMMALFGRTLLPLGAEETLVACDECGAIYDVGITTLGPEQARGVESEDELALQSVLTAMVFSDSNVRGVEKSAARDAVRHYAHRGSAPGTTTELPVKSSGGTAESFDRLARLRGVLDDGSKRRILAAAYRVCASDRELHPQEARLIVQLGDVLDLHPRQVREAMKEGRS